MNKTQKLTLAGLLAAVGVTCSAFFIPVGAAKCLPVQHMVNVLGGVLLGPWYSMAIAFTISVIRLILGTGSLLAFPGSMIGAFCCGLAYRTFKKLPAAFLGEVFGTGILGALAAWPVATLLMSREAALFAFVGPFLLSSLGGALISSLLLAALGRTHVLDRWLDRPAQTRN